MNAHVLDQLLAIVQQRKKDGQPENSYTAKLIAGGKPLCARKLGEEAVELVVAALAESEQNIIEESADLLYHWIVLMAVLDIPIEKIYQTLEARMKK